MSAARAHPPRTGAGRHWLLKSEPETFSFDSLWKAPQRRTIWGGVRNYQARNLLRDELVRGDRVLFYHSSAKPSGVAGIAAVVRAGFPDPTQFEAEDPGHDPASTRASPRWFAVEVEALERLPRFVTLAELRREPGLADMVLLQRGSRLSVQPVTPGEWRTVLLLGGTLDRGSGPKSR